MSSRQLVRAASASTAKATSAASASIASKRWSSTTNTTAPMLDKARRRRQGPLPVAPEIPSWSAPAAVSSIVHETPTPTTEPAKRHILNCLVQDGPGIIARVSGILAARGFNIHSLIGCQTGVQDLARITIVLVGPDSVVEQARRQLEDLVPVWAVLDYTNTALVQRELVLAKVNILGPEYYEDLLDHHREVISQNYGQTRDANRPEATLEEVSDNFHPKWLIASEALRHKHEHLKTITYLAEQFGGSVVDISDHSCVVQLSAKPTRIDAFLKLVAPHGILESARTGVTVLPRSTELARGSDADTMEADEVVDMSQLPPG